MKNQQRRRVFRLAAAVLGMYMGVSPLTGAAADNWVSGTVTNITSTPNGLMVLLDSGLPTNCTGSPYGWMLIPEANKTMIATALLMWTSGNRQVTVYTNATPAGSFCTINQFDPG